MGASPSALPGPETVEPGLRTPGYPGGSGHLSGRGSGMCAAQEQPFDVRVVEQFAGRPVQDETCLLYTSDAADE